MVVADGLIFVCLFSSESKRSKRYFDLANTALNLSQSRDLKEILPYRTDGMSLVLF